MLANRIFAAATIAAGLIAAPVAAVTYDAAASFTTVQGNGGFTYGSYDATLVSASVSGFVAFDSTTSCIVSNVTCLRSSSVSLPSAFKGDGTAPNYGTAILTPGKLILHPGQDTQSVYVAWTAPVAGNYSFTAEFNQQDSDTASNSVGVTGFHVTSGTGTPLFGTRFVVDQSNPDVATGVLGSYPVAAGDTFGFIIDKNGSYFNDSTGVAFTASDDAVPEPASWALMITGFAVVGVGMRRRGPAFVAA